MKPKIKGEIIVETIDQFKDKCNINLKVITFFYNFMYLVMVELLFIMMGKAVSNLANLCLKVKFCQKINN